MPAANETLFIGLISGTSRDGVDAVLVKLDDRRADLLHALCLPYPPALRDELDRLLATAAPPTRGQAAVLDERLGQFFARAANSLIEQAGVEKSDISAIGSHGQTVWHEPGGDRPRTIQLGNGSVIARYTGIRTVADFRTADLIAGGQGAPLAPLLHQWLFQSDVEMRVVLNLGGIANITLLDTHGAVSGFDTGPANCLMDAWINKHQGLDFDEDGAWAATGEVHTALLGRLLQDPYFTAPAPKSTGLEHFNLQWLNALMGNDEIDAGDVQATLAELTAVTVAQSVALERAPARMLVCGGGVHNLHLLSRLRAQLPGMEIESTLDHGAHPDWVEAILFAWLARERLAERRIETSPITGATRPVMLGRVFGKFQ